jgi:hypothetical protein
MKISQPDAAALRTVLEADLASIARIEASLHGADPASGEHATVAAAHYLSGIYSALENSFDQISRTFENHVKDLARWHRELLAKMFLDMRPFRPAVLPPECRQLMADLLSFRHFLRHGYGVDLDSGRVAELRWRWLNEGPAVRDAIRVLAQELDRIANQGA